MDPSDTQDEALICNDSDSKSTDSSDSPDSNDSNSTIRPLTREQRQARSKARIEAERRANIGNPGLEDDLREILDIIRIEQEKRRAEILSVGPPDADDMDVPYWQIFTGVFWDGVESVLPTRSITRLCQSMKLPDTLRPLVPRAWRRASKQDEDKCPPESEDRKPSVVAEYLAVSLQTTKPTSTATSAITASTTFSHSGTRHTNRDTSAPIDIPEPQGYLAIRRRESTKRRHRCHTAKVSASAPPAPLEEVLDQYAAIQTLNEDVVSAAVSLSPQSTRTLTRVLERDNENLERRGQALWWREWERVGGVWSMP